MRLGKTSAQAALATAYLACRNGQVVQARHVADHLVTPLDSALKILQTLARHGIVQSQLGRSGGYRLGHDPRNITLLSIVEAIDGPLGSDVGLPRDVGGADLLHDACESAACRIREVLGRVTVADLAERCRSRISAPAA